MAGDSAFPYSTVPNSLKKLLEKLPSIGTPQKADGAWLASLGLGGGNNQSMLPLMKQVGIIDSQGKPTEVYNAFRAKDKKAIAAGIRAGYPDLFALYPDADRKDDEALMSFGRSKTTYAEKTLQVAVRTFKTLVEFGDFDSPPVDPPHDDDDPPGRQEKQTQRRRATSQGDSGGVALTVNIQLQLPPNADGETYEKLFAAMGKHLKGLVNIE